jgi:hypothetical protein
VVPHKLTARVPTGIDQPARAAERDLLEVGRVARLARVVEGAPRRRVHLAPRAVRQPRVSEPILFG